MIESNLLNAELTLSQEEDGVWLGLIGVDVLTTPGTYFLSLTIERPGTTPLTARHPLEVIAKVFPTRQLTVEPRFVEPPPDEQARLTREYVRLNKLYETVTPRSPLNSMRQPITSDVTSIFGSRSVFNGQARSPHAGIDFRGGVGTPIEAPAGGTVVVAEDLYFTGQTVVIDHGGGMYSILAHMSEIRVRKDQQVEPGHVVGAVGATGRVTGPHLHWSIRLLGARVDPLSVLRVLNAGAMPLR
jgi:murein DD-endopeptidase MepM/ murein hydrolase activator NlpD